MMDLPPGQLSAPFHHILSLFKQHYWLIIPTACKSHWTNLCSHHPSSCSHGFFRQTKHFSQAAKDSSTHHICSSAFFSGSHGKIPWLCMHSNSCWLLSAPHYFCFPVWLPLSLNSPLPSAPFHLQLQLGPLCTDPATPLSNHQMPCLSVTADFSPLSAAHLQRPCPGSSHSLRSL